MTTISEPSFVDRDAAQLTADLIAVFEAAAGRTLLPAQPERLLIDVLAYAGNLFRINLQAAQLQSLVAFATGPALEHLGLLVGTERLGASGAITTMRFSAAAAVESDQTVPAGTRIATKDGAAIFATVQSLVVPRGSVSGEVQAQATTTGTAANGYQAGDVSVLQDTVAWVDSVLNTTVTADGVDPEGDARLRARIMEAPESFSSAGPSGAYRYHAMSASSDVLDVAVTTPEPGVVAVWPLMTGGLPGTEDLALILAALDDEKVRPICDLVEVQAPTRVEWTADARLTIYRSYDAATVLAAAVAAGETYRQARRAGLGLDLVGSQLVAALQVSGVYRVDLVGWTDRALADNEWADGSVSVTLAGVVDG